jgi:hypothetical protein
MVSGGKGRYWTVIVIVGVSAFCVFTIGVLSRRTECITGYARTIDDLPPNPRLTLLRQNIPRGASAIHFTMVPYIPAFDVKFRLDEAAFLQWMNETRREAIEVQERHEILLTLSEPTEAYAVRDGYYYKSPYRATQSDTGELPHRATILYSRPLRMVYMQWLW